MNRDDFNNLVTDTIARTADLLVKKGAEYAGDGDRLANFKRNAEKNGQTILECWQAYYGKHIDSVNSYMVRVKNRAVSLALLEVTMTSQTFYSLPVAERDDNAKVRKAFEDAADPEIFRKRVERLLPTAMTEIDKELSEPIEGRFDDIINYCILCQAILVELRGGAPASGNDVRFHSGTLKPAGVEGGGSK